MSTLTLEEEAAVLTNELLSSLIEGVNQTNQLIVQEYAALLFVIGVAGAVGVLVLLYKFMRLFY